MCELHSNNALQLPLLEFFFLYKQTFWGFKKVKGEGELWCSCKGYEKLQLEPERCVVLFTNAYTSQQFKCVFHVNMERGMFSIALPMVEIHKGQENITTS